MMLLDYPAIVEYLLLITALAMGVVSRVVLLTLALMGLGTVAAYLKPSKPQSYRTGQITPA